MLKVKLHESKLCDTLHCGDMKRDSTPAEYLLNE